MVLLPLPLLPVRSLFFFSFLLFCVACACCSFLGAVSGSAAINIRGVTVHAFAGIGVGVESGDLLIRKVRRNVKAVARWRTVRTIIIDESMSCAHFIYYPFYIDFRIVSMVGATLFDKLEYVARVLRESNEPFGGIQVC